MTNQSKITIATLLYMYLPNMIEFLYSSLLIFFLYLIHISINEHNLNFLYNYF